MHTSTRVQVRLRALKTQTPGKIEATTQDANVIARANNGKREFGFPNELRLYGPEECVGILIKHQSGTTRMIEIVSSTTGAAEKAFVLPIRFQPGFVLDPLGRIRLLFRLARPADPSRLSYADNKLHSVCHICCRLSAHSLQMYLAVSFLHDFFSSQCLVLASPRSL